MAGALITGISGFVGSHLAERLVARGTDVLGVHHTDGVENLSPVAGKVELEKFDLLDGERFAELVGSAKPSVIYHLAAQSIPALSVQDPASTLRVNVFATLNVFEAVRSSSPDTVVVNVGSSEEYGDGLVDGVPGDESTDLLPTNPYAVSKVTQDLLGYQYFRRYGLRVIRARPFNHFGPRQADAFVASSFARQVAEIEAGGSGENVLRVGNLESSRDFLDVRDVVSAYVLLAEKGEPGGAYNICSGRAVRIRHILDTLVSFSTRDIEVEVDPERYRAGDELAICGDATRLTSLGWKAEHTVEDALRDLLDYWRGKVGGAG